jgi:hypothetical protein
MLPQFVLFIFSFFSVLLNMILLTESTNISKEQNTEAGFRVTGTGRARSWTGCWLKEDGSKK